MSVIPLFFLLFLPYFTFAQQSYTLEECQKIAVENNIAFQKGQNQTRIQDQNLLQARSAHLPNLQGNLNQNARSGRSIDPFTNAFVVRQFYNFFPSLNSEIVVYQGGRLQEIVLQQKDFLLASTFGEENQKLQIKMAVLTAFFQIIYDTKALAIASEQIQASQAQKERLKILLSAGKLTPYVLTEQEARLSDENYNFQTAENNLLQSKFQLWQWLYPQKEYQDFQLVIAESEPKITPQSLSSFWEYIQENHPRLKQEKNRIIGLERQIKINKSQFKPQITLGANLYSAYSSTTPLGFSEQMDFNFAQSIGLMAIFPILDRKQTKIQVNTARLQFENAKFDIIQAKQELYKSLFEAYSRQKLSFNRFLAAEKQVLANQENYKIQELRYREGIGTFIEYQTAKIQSEKAQLNQIQAKYECLMREELLKLWE